MSTGNNQAETIVTKKRRRKVVGYIHPNKPEIKLFDFFTGDYARTGDHRLSISKEFIPILNPVGALVDQIGCWNLVEMMNPSQGTTSYERVGQKYFLKYMKVKGHIAISPRLPFTIRYKLILIKSDRSYAGVDDFFMRNYSNFQPTDVSNYGNIESYCRHNFYKTYKWPEGMAENRTSVTTISSGTLSPVDYIEKPSVTSSLGANPTLNWTFPDELRFGTAIDSITMNQVCYLPLNVSVQVNDNVDVGITHFYLLLMTDHGIGVQYPSYSSGTQYYYTATSIANRTLARFNFFVNCYFVDL